MELPNIPREYIALVFILLMTILAVVGIDSWTHAVMGMIAGYYFSNMINKGEKKNETLQQ